MPDANLTEIVTTRLKIVSEAGRPLFEIGSCENGFPRFEMMSPTDACARVIIETDEDGTRISILSENGVSLVGLGANETSGGDQRDVEGWQ